MSKFTHFEEEGVRLRNSPLPARDRSKVVSTNKEVRRGYAAVMTYLVT